MGVHCERTAYTTRYGMYLRPSCLQIMPILVPRVLHTTSEREFVTIYITG